MSGGFRSAQPFTPHCPMLFVYGHRKPFMFHAPAWARRLAEMPGCAVQALNAGHWVMANQPAQFNQLLGAWLGLTAAACIPNSNVATDLALGASDAAIPPVHTSLGAPP
jgi:hypothetical protein